MIDVSSLFPLQCMYIYKYSLSHTHKFDSFFYYLVVSTFLKVVKYFIIPIMIFSLNSVSLQTFRIFQLSVKLVSCLFFFFSCLQNINCIILLFEICLALHYGPANDPFYKCLVYIWRHNSTYANQVMFYDHFVEIYILTGFLPVDLRRCVKISSLQMQFCLTINFCFIHFETGLFKHLQILNSYILGKGKFYHD